MHFGKVLIVAQPLIVEPGIYEYTLLYEVCKCKQLLLPVFKIECKHESGI